MSGVIARCLCCLLKTRDSKHCYLMLFSWLWESIMLVVFVFIMAKRSQSITRSYFFWCERLARGSVQNLLKTKEMCFSLRLYWLDVFCFCFVVPLSAFLCKRMRILDSSCNEVKSLLGTLWCWVGKKNAPSTLNDNWNVIELLSRMNAILEWAHVIDFDKTLFCWEWRV